MPYNKKRSWEYEDYKQWIDNGSPVNNFVDTLNLSNNNLTKLSDNIGNLTNLTYFYLETNQLTYLPDSIGNLRKLTYFSLQENNITSLPNSICDLINLTYFDLNNNNLTELPNNIGNLINLSVITLEYNNLTVLPESIGNIDNLNGIMLSHNKITTLPNNIFKSNRILHIYDYNADTSKELYEKSVDNYNKTLNSFSKQIYNFNESLMNQSIIITMPNNNNYSREATITGLNPLTFSNDIILNNDEEYNFYMPNKSINELPNNNTLLNKISNKLNKDILHEINKFGGKRTNKSKKNKKSRKFKKSNKFKKSRKSRKRKNNNKSNK